MTYSEDGEGNQQRDTGSHARADREATDWLIRLHDDPEHEGLRAGFAVWLQASPHNAAAWAETEQVSRAIAAAPEWARPVGRATGAVPPLDAERRHRHRGRPIRRILLVSVTAAAACLAVLAAPDLLVQVSADAIAGTGDIRTVNLADGSIAKLAPGAALATHFANNQRQVRLLRGNAYFDIAHDPDHPFSISTGKTTTTVLGTAFEVRRQEEGVAVAVRRGLVRVSCDDGSHAELLSVGQAAKLDCGGAVRRSTLEPVRVAAWTTGQLVANDKSMREVLDGLRPWYRGLIVARGAGIDRRRVTGVYNLRDPQGALDALAGAHQARVQRITPWITVISAD